MICIVAFSDTEGNSVAYKKFNDNEMEKAIRFYESCLRNPKVNVISTRNTIPAMEKEKVKK